MNSEQRQALLLRGLSPLAAAPSPELLSSDGLEDNLYALTGFLVTLAVRFDADLSSSLPKKKQARVEALSGETPEQSQEWNDYFVGAYAAGDVNGLRELIRRAKHRDGSTVSVVAGTDAMGLVESAAIASPPFASVATANGFTVGAVVLGDFPPGSLTAFGIHAAAVPTSNLTGIASETALTRGTAQSAIPQTRATPRRPPSERDQAEGRKPTGPAALPVADVPAPAWNLLPPWATPDMGGGIVRLGDPNRPSARLAISEAIALGDSLTLSVRRLLLPAEGFAWIHDTMDPLAIASLVDLDTTRGAGLPDFTGDGGGKLQGTVAQSIGSTENRAVFYSCRLFAANGTSETFGQFADINDAKFAIATRVRELLNTEGRHHHHPADVEKV